MDLGEYMYGYVVGSILNKTPITEKEKAWPGPCASIDSPLEQLQRAVLPHQHIQNLPPEACVSVKKFIFCRKILAASGYNQLPYLVSLVLQSIQICRLFFDLGVVNHICELFLPSIQETPLWQCTDPRMHCCVNVYPLISNMVAVNSSDWIVFGFSRPLFPLDFNSSNSSVSVPWNLGISPPSTALPCWMVHSLASLTTPA